MLTVEMPTERMLTGGNAGRRNADWEICRLGEMTTEKYADWGECRLTEILTADMLTGRNDDWEICRLEEMPNEKYAN